MNVFTQGAAIFALAGLAAFGASNAQADEEHIRVTKADYQKWLRDAYLAEKRGDLARAAELYERNACAGDKASQFALGSMYLNGNGVAADGMKAFAWYRVAAESKHPQFEKAARTLRDMIPEQHRDAAEKLATAYVETYGEKATSMHCFEQPTTGSRIPTLECRPNDDRGSDYVELNACRAPNQSLTAN